MKPDTAFLWYAMVSFALAAGSLTIYMLGKDTVQIMGYKLAMWTHQAIWWPIGLGWVMQYFIDSDMLRDVYRILVYVSLGGPFLMYWVAGAFVLIFAKENDLFGEVWTYVLFLIYIAYTVGSVIFQLIFVPKVFDYLDEHMSD